MAEINGRPTKLRDILQTILLLLVIVGFIIEWKTNSARVADIGAVQAEKVLIEKRFTALETNYQNIEAMLREIKADLKQHRETGK